MPSCFFCGSKMHKQLTTFVYEEDGQVWLIRNVPAYVCSQCGEKEYSQETTRQILSFVKHPSRPPSEILHVPAYDLKAA